jgi:hypothetical protein
MKKIFKSLVTLSIAFVGVIIGIGWGFATSWDFEPIFLTLASAIEIIAFILILLFDDSSSEKDTHKSFTQNTTNVNIKIPNPQVDLNPTNKPNVDQKRDGLSDAQLRNAKIELMKESISILFIDDKSFKIIKILKDSGWKNTKIVKDIKSIDSPQIRNQNIIFVDVHGVGKILELEYEGLDLAYMIKKKYPDKFVIIYSIEKNNNSFHEVWDIIDARVMKNATPFEFSNLVENFSLNCN